MHAHILDKCPFEQVLREHGSVISCRNPFPSLSLSLSLSLFLSLSLSLSIYLSFYQHIYILSKYLSISLQGYYDSHLKHLMAQFCCTSYHHYTCLSRFHFPKWHFQNACSRAEHC